MKNIKSITCVILAFALIFVLSGCKKDAEEEETTAEVATVEDTTAATTVPVTTTAPVTTTIPESTTAAPGESIKNITDVLQSKSFYISGVMNFNGDQKMNAAMSYSGEDTKLDISSSQMNISMIYLSGVPYVANNNSMKYIEINDQSLDGLEQLSSTFSSMGVSFNNNDIAELKNMINNMDQNIDLSQYIEGGEYYESERTIDGQKYLCSSYETDNGTIYIYTQNGELKRFDVYDTDGLRQMMFEVTAFVGKPITAISINGYSQSASLLNLFTGS